MTEYLCGSLIHLWLTSRSIVEGSASLPLSCSLMDGPSAQLASLLLRARAHVFPQGWLDLDEILPYRAVNKWVSVAVGGLIRGVYLGFVRQARAARRYRHVTAALESGGLVGSRDLDD